MSIERITKHIKIMDSDVIKYIIDNNVTHVYFEQKVIWGVNDKSIVLIFKKIENPEGKRKAIELLKYKKCFFKIRTPLILRSLFGQEMEVHKDHFNGPPDEVFRIKPRSFTIKAKYPFFLKSGVLVIPSIYINSVIKDNNYMLMVSFNDTNEKMIEDGYVIAYLTNKNINGSHPLYKVGMGLRTKTLVAMLTYCGRLGKHLHDYIYHDTVHFDGYHQFGSMGFVHREHYGKTLSPVR